MACLAQMFTTEGIEVIVTCNEDQYKGMKTVFCGKTFDDAECSTICPHNPLPPPLTKEQIEEQFSKMREAVEEEFPGTFGGDSE